MENFFLTYVVEIILTAVGISSTVIIAIIFKYVWKADIEKTFEANIDYSYKILFSELMRVDNFKKTIFELLEKESNFNPDKSDTITMSKSNYEEILRYRNLIEEILNRVKINQKHFTFLEIEKFIVIQQYILSSLNIVTQISGNQNTIYYHIKSLEYHMYYAKKIIEIFGKKTNYDFKNKWMYEFIRVRNGIENVTWPDIEPGDIIGLHFNIQNEVLYYDPIYSQIWIKLNEISDLTKYKCS